jgi:RNA polymerase sigma-70 factor (ECF subfamily)
VIAALAVHLRDLDLAEDAFAEAMARCLELPEAPRNVAGWLLTAAKRKAVDAIRRREAEARAVAGSLVIAEQADDMAEILKFSEPIADERLRLIFICCHPAIALEARAALALKVICGLPVKEIARVFVTSQQTMFQRITRAKAKVQAAGIAFELPPRKAWGERLEAVLLTLELAYTAAFQDAAGERDDELPSEVERLARMVAELLPEEPEALGLTALILLARSRERARVDGDGAMVPLSQQDTKKWDYPAIEQARRWMDSAAAQGATGPYQIMAAIQLTHARRGFDAETDWAAIAALYDALMVMRPGAMTAINRAVALAKVQGAARGLEALERMDAEALQNARPFYVARGELLAQLGENEAAAQALDRAIALDPARAERLFLEAKRRALLRKV